MTYIILVLGFLLLIKGAGYFVEGASNIAHILKVPKMLVGLTIVAFGTSAPEAAVSIRAAMGGSAGIVLGNAVGSNLFNISLIVGVTAMINPLKVEEETVRKEIPFTVLSSILLFILIKDQSFQGSMQSVITRGDGLVLMSFFSIFMYYLFEVVRNNRKNQIEKENKENVKNDSMIKNIVFTIGGCTSIVFGGDLVVKSGTKIAYSFGMSETLVGLTIISMGTSLPELITCITAALKKHSDIAVGNIVGSNIFNTLFVLGTSSIISPILVDEKVFTDVLFMIVYMIILFAFSKTRHRISKVEGGVLFLSYVLYLGYIVIRN